MVLNGVDGDDCGVDLLVLAGDWLPRDALLLVFSVVPIEVKDVIGAGSGKGGQAQGDDKLREGRKRSEDKWGESEGKGVYNEGGAW